MIRIYETTEKSRRVVTGVDRLLRQLAATLPPFDEERLGRIVATPDAHLLLAETADGRIVGMLSVALYDVPSGRKAWIEDVVVDAAARGAGVGERLVREALTLARREGAVKVLLTSNAARQAAHRLYERVGFVCYDTDVFRYEF